MMAATINTEEASVKYLALMGNKQTASEARIGGTK
jgi:hypothetical protein